MRDTITRALRGLAEATVASLRQGARRPRAQGHVLDRRGVKAQIGGLQPLEVVGLREDGEFRSDDPAVLFLGVGNELVLRVYLREDPEIAQWRQYDFAVEEDASAEGGLRCHPRERTPR